MELLCQMNPNLFQRRTRSLGAGRAALPTCCILASPVLKPDIELPTLLGWRGRGVWHLSLFHLQISSQCWMCLIHFYPLLIRYFLSSRKNKAWIITASFFQAILVRSRETPFSCQDCIQLSVVETFLREAKNEFFKFWLFRSSAVDEEETEEEKKKGKGKGEGRRRRGKR